MRKPTYFSNSIALSDFLSSLSITLSTDRSAIKQLNEKSKQEEKFDDLISFNIISPSMLFNTGLLREMWISDINYFYDNTTVKQFYAPITLLILFIYFFDTFKICSQHRIPIN